MSRPRGFPAGLAVIVSVLLLTCGPANAPPPHDEHPRDRDYPAQWCRAEVTPIPAIQGDDYRSAVTGQFVTVRGVVTKPQPGRGFYLEDASAPPAPRSSRALYVEVTGDDLPLTGQLLTVRGQVAERGASRDTLTSLVDVELSAPCGEVSELPLTPTALPLDSHQREALEGMRIAFDGELVVTDVYNAHRGEWTVAAGEPLRIPTEVALPGAPAARIARDNRQRQLAVRLAVGAHATMPVGARLALHGVMGHDGQAGRLLADRSIIRASPDWPGDPLSAGDRLRVVSMNLLNYFNGDGRGGGFPAERGARTAEAFEEQQSRTRAALAKIRPDLLAVQELENDGFGPDSAAHSLLALLEESNDTDWAVVDSGVGPIGGDVITVGLFFQPRKLEAVGPPETLRSTPFQGLSRQPLAQRFRDLASGAEFWVAVNHLKSKGSCPETGPNRDQDDGQGCWSPARVAAVNVLLPWLERLSQATGTERVLILGDMNAWRQEDPIRAYRQAGYLELVEQRSGSPQYSYLYYGQRGTLDYAFASPALARFTHQAFIWHINADMPRKGSLPQPWLRMSDHDPVIVDLDFSQMSTSD